MMGRIHSIESMGLTDGPGIRYVVFLQGCKIRCAYCHNPDTWDINGGKEVSPKELVKKILRFKPYFQGSGGGITCSGGDPLMQPEFLIEFLKLCKKNGIHTAIDTAGFGKGKYKEVLKYTDLVILDIKHFNKDGFKELTGGSFEEFVDFCDIVKKSNVKLWIRHVIIPGITDDNKHLKELKNMINEFNNVEKVELLPYHTLGSHKYKLMNIPYKLDGIKPMCNKETRKMERKIPIVFQQSQPYT